MTNRTSTRRALWSSVMALLLCCTMLIGTTFAWFTDTASTNVNTIQAGTLDVALEVKEGNNWVSAEGKTLDFVKAAGHENEAILWEPGCTYKLPELRIVNKGNLALKYKVIITGINGDAKLNEAIEWAIDGVAMGNEYSLAVEGTKEFTISGHMKESAGNAYQGLSIEGISITVYATQDTVEYDSTDNTYDDGAEFGTAKPNTTAKLITAGNLTINENLSIDSNVTGGNSDVIRITGGDHTITGGFYTAYGTNSNSVLRVDGGNVIIKGGYFEVKEDNNCIYAAGGNITIEGGTFKSEKEYAGHYWVLNCKDNSGSVITVKGGAFYKFDPSNANTGKGEIVVAEGYKVVNNGDWYYVVPENATEVSDAAALNAAVADGGTIVLNDGIIASDIINITKDVTIYGCGNTITAASGKDRVFNVQGTSTDITIKLTDLTIGNNNNIAYDRAISFGGDPEFANTGKIRLEMDNCNVSTQHYAINVAKNNADIEIIVKNSNLTGYAAVQTWSANSKITLEYCTLNGVNKWDGTDNDFSTVNVNETAEGSIVTLNNCTIQNTTSGTAKQTFFGIAANATVTATDCSYESNGAAVSANAVRENAGEEYVYIATGAYTLTIN